MQRSGDLLVFVPTYNEAENIRPLFDRISAAVPTADILFLDDNSPDGSGRIIDELAEQNPNVFAIHRAGKLGIGSAHIAGIRWAYAHGYHKLVSMDCDFTHSPERITDFLEGGDDYDVVVGSRYLQPGSLRTWNLLRKTLTRVGHFLTTSLLQMPFDATGAFRMYRIDRIPGGTFDLVYSQSYSFFFESLYVLWLNHWRVKEIPLELPARTYGHSKMAWKDAARSTVLLGYLFLKTHIDPKTMIYAEPYRIPDDLDGGKVQQEWDAYWNANNKSGALLYDLIAAFYRKFIIRGIVNHFIGKHCPPGAQLLHAGAGSGQVDTDIAHRVSISALDISPQALGLYRKFQPNFTRLIHGSIFQIPLPPSEVDAVYNLGVMEHFTEPEINAILQEFHRVVRPGGKIILFWPPAFGITVRVLSAVHWLLRRMGRPDVKLHPDEITHVRSKQQVRTYLEQNGFRLIEFYFGPRDLFTHAIVVGQKGAATSVAVAADAAVSSVEPQSLRLDRSNI